MSKTAKNEVQFLRTGEKSADPIHTHVSRSSLCCSVTVPNMKMHFPNETTMYYIYDKFKKRETNSEALLEKGLHAKMKISNTTCNEL